ncbi:hypothetical protein ACFJGV_08520 [Cnuibacter sp. UC19_7]|uniref:hypothetical protein n=1 Tax=Cnuibacter sp. UC19_7 TaxID=3350166 RepID=UPI00366C7EE5
MEEAQQYVRWRASVGAEPEAVIRELTYSGWAQPAATALVAGVWPPVKGRGQWMLVVTLVMGVAILVVTVQLLVSVWAYPGGPRATYALLEGIGPAFGNYLLVTVPLWLIGLVLLIVHLSTARRGWATVKLVSPRSSALRARTTLLTFSWILIIGNPILSAVVWVVLLVQYVALGVMCGEAVSATCGMGGSAT